MKKMLIWGGVMLAMVFGTLTPAVAGTLQEDYKAVEAKRRALEKKRMDYENRQEAVSAEMQQVTKELNDCIYETRMKALEKRKHKIYESWRTIWESRLKEAEMARRSAEEVRRSLTRLWRDLSDVRKKFEDMRREIEQKHTYKGPGTAYEREFRAYMKRMEENYFDRIENELFAGYDEYLNGARGYLKLLSNSLQMCRENDLGVPGEATSR